MRTLAYFGSTAPFEPLRSGILALHPNRQQQRAQGAATEASAEKETAAFAGDGMSAPTHQDVQYPMHDVKAEDFIL